MLLITETAAMVNPVFRCFHAYGLPAAHSSDRIPGPFLDNAGLSPSRSTSRYLHGNALNTSKNGISAMLCRNVMNQLLNEGPSCLQRPTSNRPIFPPFCIRGPRRSITLIPVSKISATGLCSSMTADPVDSPFLAFLLTVRRCQSSHRDVKKASSDVCSPTEP